MAATTWAVHLQSAASRSTPTVPRNSSGDVTPSARARTNRVRHGALQAQRLPAHRHAELVDASKRIAPREAAKCLKLLLAEKVEEDAVREGAVAETPVLHKRAKAHTCTPVIAITATNHRNDYPNPKPIPPPTTNDQQQTINNK